MDNSRWRDLNTTQIIYLWLLHFNHWTFFLRLLKKRLFPIQKCFSKTLAVTFKHGFIINYPGLSMSLSTKSLLNV